MDPETQARIEALLEVAGLATAHREGGKEAAGGAASAAGGKALTDPEVLKHLTRCGGYYCNFLCELKMIMIKFQFCVLRLGRGGRGSNSDEEGGGLGSCCGGRGR